MTLLYVDTNIFIRYVTRDNPDLAARAKNFLDQVEDGTLQVTTSETVIGEVIFVLSSKKLYNLPREEIRTFVSTIIMMRGMKLSNKSVYKQALDLYVSVPRLDFSDAFSIALMEHLRIDTIVSFDKDFDGIEGVRRQEP